jgi:heptaprenyl diphosphate synthase
MINENVTKNDAVTFVTFDAALELVKIEVDKTLSASPKIIRAYTEHLTLSRGKFIRAISLLACAENKSGLIHPNAVQLAAAVELLHLATLVHDDVIDNAKTRRGVITLQKKYGKKTAVICGDYLLCVSLQRVSSITNKKDYLDFGMPDYMSRVCLGEIKQNINNGNVNLSVYEYLKIISGKTAALFEASFYAGAILCEDAKNEINQYSRLGHFMGMIFQLTDDCIDFEASPELAKKPVQSDFEQGVITLPLIYAFQKRNGFKEKAKTNEVCRNEINAAVFETGGLSYTRMVSKKYYTKALQILEKLDVNEDKKTKLLCILEKVYGGLKK